MSDASSKTTTAALEHGRRRRRTVLCAGRVYTDLVFAKLQRMPTLGEEVFADELSLHAGGGAYITAAWLAALGRPAELCTNLPVEPFGSIVARQAKASGVALGTSKTRRFGDPQLTVAMVDNGDRAFLSRRTGKALPDQAAHALLNPSLRHLHISELTTLLEYPELAATASQAGLTVSVDCGWDDAAFEREDLPQYFQHVDLFLPNAREAEALARLGVSTDLVPLTVIKRGHLGAEGHSKSEHVKADAPAVEAVDTTGAGDAFNAGFLNAWLDERSLAECLDAGNRCGSLAVTRCGGADELPSLIDPRADDSTPKPSLSGLAGHPPSLSTDTVRVETPVDSSGDRSGKTAMRREIEEIPAAAARLLDADRQVAIKREANRLAAVDPHLIVTVARGSSDHAATCLAHAIGVTLGRPVASLTPALASIYDVPLRCGSSAGIAISQSGSSSDLVALTEGLECTGTPVLALTNTTGSDITRAASSSLDIGAGTEHAVAATKSYMNSILVGLWLVARWSGSKPLAQALEHVPERLHAALERDMSAFTELLDRSDRLVVLGRGPALGLAGEAALKAIETCGIHASAYSAAEILHGPSALLVDDFPVLVLNATNGRGIDAALDRLPGQGARLVAADDRARNRLPDVPTSHPLVHALDEMMGVYAVLEAEARRRGRDPDRPAHLAKATDTV